ncbi:MAG: DUF6553 family protein [Lachnospiraceae bacterium]|nr:DUF6553 family protein [Lachnospiraceae bacterium]
MEFSIRGQAKKKEGLLTEEELAKRFLNWPDAFYQERSPKIRLQMLDRADELGLAKEENALRRQILLARYPALAKKGAESPDLYLRAWMEFRFEAHNAGGPFARKKRAEALQVLKDMGYFQAETEEEKRLLAQEISHLGTLYISLCHEDKGYTSVVFGLGSLSQDTIVRKIATEFRSVAIDAPRKLSLEKECEIWTRSLVSAFQALYPEEEL